MDTYLLIDNKKIEIDKSVPFPVSYTLADIKDPSKRKRSVSKTLDVPATQNNIAFFQSAYSLTWTTKDGVVSSVNYDPTQSYQCEYYVDNALTFRGFIQLLTVKINKGIGTFQMVMFSDVSSMFQRWGDLLVSELGWSEYDHELNHTNIENSFDTSVILNGVATSNFTGSQPDGWGYHYGLVDYGFSSDQETFDDNTIFPMIYQREIIIKAFEWLGFEIDSNLIESTAFKKYLFGSGGGELFELPDATISDLYVEFTGDGTRSEEATMVNDFVDWTVPGFPPPTNDFIATGGITNSYWLTDNSNADFTVTVVTDALNQTTTGNVFVPITANYRINVSFDLILDVALTGTGTKTVDTQIRVVFVKNNAAQVLDIVNYTGEQTATVVSYDQGFDVDLTAGDNYYIRILYSSTASIYSATEDYGDLTVDLDFNNSFELTQNCISGIIENGSTINLSNYIPKMKVTDYMKGIINHIHLYISEPDESNVVTIESLDDFYFDNSQYDTWTDKQDLNRPIEIEPILITQPKEFRYKFAEDKDYYKQKYFDEFGVHYGDYTYTNPAYFATGQVEFKLPYTVTPSVEIDGTNLVIPRIIKVENGVISPFKGKARVYIWGGLRTGDWIIGGTNGASDTALTSYPCVSHLNDVDDPTFDLCFGNPQRLYYNATKFTTNDIFNLFYFRFINEITNQDSKMAKSYFRLNSDDTKGDFLRRVKNVDGVLYRVNLIRDYNLNLDSSTYCELIKIIDVKSPRDFTIDLPAADPPLYAPETIDDFQNGYTAVKAGKQPNVKNTKQTTTFQGIELEGSINMDGSIILE